MCMHLYKNRIYVLVILIVVGLVAYFYIANNKTERNNMSASKYSLENDNKHKINTPPKAAPVSSSEEKITPNTEIIYKYYYELDDKSVEEKEQAPYYMINLDKEELVEKYSDWEIKNFSSKQVVMEKTLKEKSPLYYRIGEKDGYIAVYYEKPVNGISLKEITDTPISALPKDEQERIKKGIEVYGEDELIRMLEDYSS